MAQKYCMYCGAALPEGSRFCMDCGRPVEQGNTETFEPDAATQNRCPYCGAENDPSDRFCVQCGAPLGVADHDRTVVVDETKYGNVKKDKASAYGAASEPVWEPSEPLRDDPRVSSYDPPTSAVTPDPVVVGPTNVQPGGGNNRGGTRGLPVVPLVAGVAALAACGIAWVLMSGTIFGGGSTTDGSSAGEETQIESGETVTSGEEEAPTESATSGETEDEAIERAKERISEQEETATSPTQTTDETTGSESTSSKDAGTAQISIPGVDGTVRNETIRLDGSSERIFADSNTRVLSSDEIARLTDAELCIAWNEIIASKGYVFKNEGLRTYFSSCSWYTADPSAAGDTSGLSDAAGVNVRNLQEALRDSWWREKLT